MVEATIIKEIIAAIIAGIVLYIGFINKMRTEISLLKLQTEQLEEKCKEVTDLLTHQNSTNTLLEEKVKHMETRQESHSKKYDELLQVITELKLEMVKQFSRLTSEINSFNSMVEASDKGVKINKKKK